MTPIMTEHLNWASTIGLFIINYGVLDWHFLVFLEKRISPDEFTQIKEKNFHDRVIRMKALIESDRFSDIQKARFGSFFAQVDRIRTLRNHIAHGHLLIRAAEDCKSGTLALSLPKDLDANYAPRTRHVEIQELTNALSELTALIEEFRGLAGGWSDYEEINI